MTVTQALTMLRDRFAPVSGDFALPEAERVLMFLLNCERSRLYLNGNEPMSETGEKKISSIVKRRSLDEPLAYILGSVYFFNREFIVGPDVLIPRPETELLVEEVLKTESREGRRFIDLGTGSGCIAGILIGERPSWQGIAIDRYAGTLAIARTNLNRSCFVLCGDRLAPIKPHGFFDFIVSNPPYVRSGDIESLPFSIRNYEPIAALDGGTDGLVFYRYIAGKAFAYLTTGGRIYCEIGFDQGKSAAAIFKKHGWDGIMIRNDLCGRSRVLRATKPDNKQ
jgi:release factor glutamine methyltransferase